MSATKDSDDVVEFMSLFHKLREMIDDTPTDLPAIVANDPSVEAICHNLYWAANTLSMKEREHRQLFAAPVDPKFIEYWRDYEERYNAPLAGVMLSDLVGAEINLSEEHKNLKSFDFHWQNADADAAEMSKAINFALEFAEEQATQDWREFPEGFAEDIEEGIAAWKRLSKQTGFDLRSIFRRRELVPFVLIPRHVSRLHGEAEKLSLFTILQQAHDAFVFGVPFAAIALMRSLLETVLREHYQANGSDLAERIKNCRGLPRASSKEALHRIRQLANDVLHSTSDQVRLPLDFEKEILSLLYVLRALIEGAPTWRSR